MQIVLSCIIALNLNPQTIVTHTLLFRLILNPSVEMRRTIVRLMREREVKPRLEQHALLRLRLNG